MNAGRRWLTYDMSVCPYLVLARLLRPHRCRRVVEVAAQHVGCARNLHRLAALHLQLARHAHHQLGREGAAVGRLVQLLRVGRRLEGPRRAVPGLRRPRRRHGGRRRRLRPQVRRPAGRVAHDGHGRREHRRQRPRRPLLRRLVGQPEHGGRV